MIKRILLFSVSIITTGLVTNAQVTTRATLLKEAAAETKIKEDANYQKALVLAKEKGWDLVLTSRKGSKAYLIGSFEDGSPKYYTTFNNTIAAATTRANQLWNGGASGLNLSGSSANMKNKLAIWDGGKVLSTHVELTGRITQKDAASSNSNHATHVTGTMMATGINPIAKGMAYGLQGILAYDFSNDISEIMAESPNIVLSNHSYGIISGWYYNSAPSGGGAARWEFRGRPGENEDYKFGYYSVDAQSLDSIAYNAPYYLIVKAAGNNRNDNGPAVGSPYFRIDATGTYVDAGNRPAGISSNDGYDITPWDANAKNILTIGAVQGLTSAYTKPSDVVLSSFSSWGPTDDGRIKPDLVADGVNVTSTIASGNSDYESESGTSMASPNTTGSLLLLQEYYSQLKAGVFMKSATLKGLAIHTAEEAGDNPGPDYKFGWGLVNVERGASVIKAAVTSNNAATSQHLLYENNLANGATKSYTVIASGKGQLSATICWTDVKGAVTPLANALNDPTSKLVNDLDLIITKGSSVYKPWILDPVVPAAAATKGNNIRDNVERINIDSVVPGQTYTITISHKGTLARGSQDYSLLVSGVGGTATCISNATNASGTRIDSVGYGTIQNKTSGTTCTTYRDFTNLSADLEPSKTMPISVKVGSCDATNANKIVKVFIDYDGNGTFDASELVATSGILTNGMTFTTNITTPGTLVKGNYAIMRVVAQEAATATAVNACGTYANGETQDYRVRFVQAANDVAVTELITPITGSGSNNAQLIAVRIQNNGTIDKTGIPLTATVLNGTTTVATINVICPLIIPGLSSVVYTFQKTFNSLPATNYTITVTANLVGDQDLSNNTLTSNVATAANPAAPAATGTICSTSAVFKITNPVAGLNYFWYDTPTSTTPIGTGTTLTLTTLPTNNTVYVSSGVRSGVGIKSKNDYPSGGGYQAPGGNYMKYTATTPVILESVRLFTRYPGTLNLNLFNITNEASTGSYNYFDLGTTIINAYSSHPSPLQGPVSGNDAADTGAIYYLGLSLPSAGASVSYALRMIGIYGSGTTDSVNIFRNNNLPATPSLYPFTTPTGIFSFTGNSAQSTSPTTYQQFYYYFYDMKLKTIDNVSDRAAIVGVLSSAPTITIVGAASDSLQTNAVSNIQWYLDGNAIANANTVRIKPIYSGTYTVTGADANGCTKTSVGKIYTATTAVVNVNNDEIALSTTPNPNNGVFKINFKVNTKADLQIQLLDISGKTTFTKAYPNFVGTFSEQFTTGNIASGNYILKIQHGNKVYRSKLFIVK